MTPQTVTFSFAQGLNTKTDPWQLPVGQFISLQNSVFTKGGQLRKRNGFQYLSSLPSTETATYLTTLNNNLVAAGDSIFAYDTPNNTWVSRGTYTPLEVATLPLIRNSLGQIQTDAAIAPNGIVCTAYTEATGTAIDYKFCLADSTTGQNIIEPTLIPVSAGVVSGSPRVFLIGTFFIIVFTRLVSATSHLTYITVNSAIPASTNLPTNDIATSYIPSPGLSWDGVVVGDNLYIAYNTTSGGQAINVTYLTRSQAILGSTPETPANYTGYTATLMSLCSDITQANPYIYVNFYDSGSSTGYSLAVSVSLAPSMVPTEIITSGTILNLASVAQNNTCAIYYEVSNSYGYDSSIPTDYISTVSITPTLPTPTVSSPYIVVRSVGLASKAFIVNGTEYFLAAYESSAAAGAGYQPTYFLLNGTLSVETEPIIVAKLAYSNGGGYLTLGLPSVTVQGDLCEFSYLYKDLVEAQAQPAVQSINTKAPAVFTQTGINLAKLTFSTQNIDSVEIAGGLQISGGFGWGYDGYLPVEENFFLWPDSVEVTSSDASLTPTGTVTSGSAVITAVSSTAGIGYGMNVSGTSIPTGATVLSFTSSTITMSAAATGNHTAETITLTGSINGQPSGYVSGQPSYYYQAIYDWTDNQGNEYRSAPSIPVPTGTLTSSTAYINTIYVPTLRLTYKTASPIKIRLYRWSVANQVYYEVTSITQPTFNNLSVDYVTIVDALADASIIGNNIIYTTGGVVENVNSPASNIITLFDTRSWKVDAEDGNLLWYSKQVIEAAPVEWSDLFTLYIAPNIGVSGSTGPVTALAPMDDKLILMKRDSLYFINGTGPDITGANSTYSQPIFITSAIGCTNQQSIVLTPDGLMFQTDKGIWLLNRSLGTEYVGAAVEEFNSSVVNSAICVPETTQIRFTLDTGEVLMYDYYYKQWGTFEGIPEISSCVCDSLHTFLNTYGGVYQEQPGSYLDGDNPVLMSFTTSWLNLASLQGYERFYEFYLLGQYLSPHKLMCTVAYDYNSSPPNSTLITPRNFSSSTPSPFGVPVPVGAPGNLEQWRIHSKKQLCQSFQLSIQEVFDPSFGTVAGAGLTMSGISCEVGIKKARRPIAGVTSAGVS